MGRTGHVQIGRKLKGDKCNPKEKPASKVSNINTDLIEYVPKTLVKKELIKNLNMSILLSTVFRIYLCQSQTQYQIHTTIKDHKLIVLQQIHQHRIL